MIRSVLRALFSVSLLAILSGCSPERPGNLSKEPEEHAGVPERIISTVPSITETLYALGLGDHIVGTSQFCIYPPEIIERNLPKVGGLTDQNREAVLKLNPDLIIVLQEDIERANFYRRLGLRVMTVDHTSVAGIMNSFEIVAKPFGPEAEKKAREIKAELQKRLDDITAKTAKLSRPKTLICIDRTHGENRLQGLMMAGKQPFFEDVLRYAGAENALSNSSIAVPLVSVEIILRANPEVIIDLSMATSGANQPDLDDWNTLGQEVDAVRNKRISMLKEDYATVPGPRFILLIEKLYDILHKAAGPSPKTAAAD